MKKLNFFATSNDIESVLKTFENSFPMKFVETGRRASPNRATYLESSEIPGLGTATHETAARSQGYMVSHRDTKNHMRVKTSTITGKKYWDLFGADNEQAILLTLGGIWETGTLLPGLADTMHENSVTKELLNAFSSSLKKAGYKKVKMWWVGPEAMEMLEAGKRLATTAEQSPPSMDLKLPTDK